MQCFIVVTKKITTKDGSILKDGGTGQWGRGGGCYGEANGT